MRALRFVAIALLVAVAAPVRAAVPPASAQHAIAIVINGNALPIGPERDTHQILAGFHNE